MADTMERLLLQQEKNIRAVMRIVENFKKVGKDNFTVAAVEDRRTLLDQRWSVIRDTDMEICMIATSSDKRSRPYFTEDQFTTAEDAFFAARSYFANLLEQLRASRQEERATDPAGNPPQESAAMPQLPSIPLPRFAGSYLDWPGFSDLFEDLVINRPGLTDSQRLYYLKGCLEGSAFQLVSQIPSTRANFLAAWEALRTRYENKRVVVAHLLNRFLLLPPIGRDVPSDLSNLRDTTNQSLALLANLGRPTQTWDDLLVHILVQKFDVKTREKWENFLGASKEVPDFQQLESFLETRIESMKAVQQSRDTLTASAHQGTTRPQRSSSLRAVTARPGETPCVVCREKHPLFRCNRFKAATVTQRLSIVRENKRCVNCLRSGHSVSACPSSFTCARCGKKHHSLLHPDQSRPTPSTTGTGTEDTTGAEAATVSESSLFCSQAESNRPPAIILATALVRVRSNNGRTTVARALLDQGSEATFISESLAQVLRAPRSRAMTRVTGVGETEVGYARSRVSLDITACKGSTDTIPVSALVLPRLSAFNIRRLTGENRWPHLWGLKLADPVPHQSRAIDLILGADVYGALLRPGLRQAGARSPVAQNTIFGWVLSGPVDGAYGDTNITTTSAHCTVEQDLSATLRAFWEVEELTEPPPMTPDEARCERHFLETHRRLPDGRYVVRLPFKGESPSPIGESFKRAACLLGKVEGRLLKSPPLAEAYSAFLQEYEALGHMCQVTAPLPTTKVRVYLPHHPVLKSGEHGPKLRVVFNASSATSNGSSLNDLLLVGPKMQQDLVSIILRWRKYRFAYKADIVKMFRQIRVDSRDVDHQRILWRRAPTGTLTPFQLLTVTYGTASAPFLANRVLRQLAIDDGASFPLGRQILERHFYVDDALFGADELDDAIRCKDQVTRLLQGAGFPLGKWAANCPELLPEAGHTPSAAVDLPSQDADDSLAVLGISWSTMTDEFLFRCHLPPAQHTKRGILSTIAKLYDPLGWLSPVLIGAKIMIQELWLAHVEWDDPLPAEIAHRWQGFITSFRGLRDIRVPRWLASSSKHALELHGFSDASTRAYSAVVYARVTAPSGEITTSLLVAKTKVAPVKTISVPRLELCGAVLLVRLLKKVIDEADLGQERIHTWTDSTVVLAWLSRHPSSWQCFVANRVSYILDTLPNTTWHHVPTADNPADAASRGVTPKELLESTLWWKGPSWLSQDQATWPTTSDLAHNLQAPEARVHVSHLQESSTQEPLERVFSRFSSWPRLLRTTAVLLRFCDTARHQEVSSKGSAANYITRARIAWMRYLQCIHFGAELTALRDHRPICSSSKLRALNPFLDDTGLLRVGGRLTHSRLPFQSKHPVILPRHYVTELLVRQFHQQTLHGGPQLTLCVMRQSFWVLEARNLVRKIHRLCVTCTRHRAATPQQIMGDLPTARVTPARPFTNTGVDYAGPIPVRLSKGRGHKSQKAYIALFVCLATRAIHLELVSDYSTPGFLAAFQRFVSRRGRPAALYSDNGTNFVGAERELRREYARATSDPDFQQHLADREITWHFIPPGAPHFGGLWEAGVRSAKHHLRRVTGSHMLTFEELTTLLCMVEACLNSRPLSAASPLPEDFECLTPGHFLVGGPLLGTPELTSPDSAETLLSRWHLVRRLQESFWKRWHLEYLQELQRRVKWQRERRNFSVGDLVLLRTPSSPPSQWPLGRVVDCSPGQDGRVRVVNVRTANGSFTRPISQLCLLPMAAQDE